MENDDEILWEDSADLLSVSHVFSLFIVIKKEPISNNIRIGVVGSYLVLFIKVNYIWEIIS